ncbi:sulfotransferase family 2 domain-containing protein [Candidatus Ferrigenium straubiae]|uniref:sulfotransferase family 2 domain-containing protein n=1 Tax=Candidatus Ferrigenium straubiae TaxID=2919506 RepID=UPI003F4ADD0A
MKKINFIVHVPKTAGTSFRRALHGNEQVRMLYGYGKEFHESACELAGINPMEMTPESEIFDADKFNFICGHVPYSGYAHCVPPDAVVSIVRNPVERIVSAYQHVKRHYGYARSFADFSSAPDNRNVQWKMLGELGSESGALIGLTSHYRYFVGIFSTRFGLPVESILANRAPDSDAEDRINIPPAEIKAAYLYNQQDIGFFFEKVGVFSERVRDAGYNTAPTRDTNWNCLIAGGKRIVGWLSCAETDCYFLEIGVNGERRAVISLDKDRNDICSLGLSESPVCGFSYPLALLGTEAGDKVTVGVLGAPGFARTLHLDWEH